MTNQNSTLNTKVIDTIQVTKKGFEELNKNLNDIHYDIHKKVNAPEDKFLGATYDTVFTVFTTLLIFIAGIAIDRVLKARQEKKELKDLRAYFFNQIKEIVFAIGPNLIGGYKKYYQNEITIDSGIPATPPKVLANNFERLHRLESVKLYSSFSKKEQDNFNEYFSHIDFLANLLKEIDIFHTLVLKRSEIARSELGPLVNAFYKSIAEFAMNIEVVNPNFANDPHHAFILAKLKLYKKEVSGKRALKLFHNEILVPTIEYFKNQNLHTQHPIGVNVYDYGRQAVIKYHDLKFLVTEVRLQYRTFYKKIKKSIEKLKEFTEN